MLNTSSLNSLNDRPWYTAHFMDLAMWETYVMQVCAWHGFRCNTIVPGIPGTYPTFIVEVEDAPIQLSKAIVVKFFGPLFNGANSFEVEKDLGYWLEKQFLPIPSPGICAYGRLDENWQYLVFEYIHGMSIGQARDQLTKEDWSMVACQVGEYIRCLHDLTRDDQHAIPISLQSCMNRFVGFLEQQRIKCAVNHRAWNDLPEHLLTQVEDFTLPVDQLINISAPLYLIHADLTSDHLLGKVRKGVWHTQAIIDWGDAMIGNVLYELVSIHLDLFGSEKTLLRLCLDMYDLPEFYRKDFPQKALSMVLLHQFPMPEQIYAPYREAQSLWELADRMFAV